MIAPGTSHQARLPSVPTSHRLRHSTLAIVVTILCTLGLLQPIPAHAQAPASQSIVGTWQGTLHAGRDLRIVFKIAKDDKGGYTAMNYSVDQQGARIPVKTLTFEGGTIKATMPMVGGTYEGKLSADGNTIVGTFSQGSPLPLVLTRATPETEWTIPEPPPPAKPMDPASHPGFEVATIKPSKPDEKGKMLIFTGHEFKTVNQPLSFLIAFSYGVHPRQIVGAPDWYDTQKFDITAIPDTPGVPNATQLKEMVRSLLADRFKFTIHHDKKELSVYVLSVAKSGPKMTKSEGDPEGLPGFGFRGLGKLNVMHASMPEFAQMMQETVLDRPVIDQTALADKWDFTLNWTVDDSQFGGAAAGAPPSTDPNPPPNLYTAIQEQIGLKLDATKASTDVLVVDHVEKPSEN